MSTVTTRLGLTKPASIEQYNLATYNNNLDLIDAYVSGTADNFAKGVVYEQIVQSNSGSITSLAVVNNIASFTFKANRRYEISWEQHIVGSDDGNYADCAIQTCSTADAANLTTGLTMKRQITQRLFQTINPFRVFVPVVYGTDTTLQVKFTTARTAGTGTTIVEATSARLGVIHIRDIGDQI